MNTQNTQVTVHIVGDWGDSGITEWIQAWYSVTDDWLCLVAEEQADAYLVVGGYDADELRLSLDYTRFPHKPVYWLVEHQPGIVVFENVRAVKDFLEFLRETNEPIPWAGWEEYEVCGYAAWWVSHEKRGFYRLSSDSGIS